MKLYTKTNRKWWEFWKPRYLEAVGLEEKPPEPDPIVGGRVIKISQGSIRPVPPKKGGKVLKVMPRELKKIKEAQESTDEVYKLPEE